MRQSRWERPLTRLPGVPQFGGAAVCHPVVSLRWRACAGLLPRRGALPGARRDPMLRRAPPGMGLRPTLAAWSVGGFHPAPVARPTLDQTPAAPAAGGASSLSMLRTPMDLGSWQGLASGPSQPSRTRSAPTDLGTLRRAHPTCRRLGVLQARRPSATPKCPPGVVSAGADRIAHFDHERRATRLLASSTRAHLRADAPCRIRGEGDGACRGAGRCLTCAPSRAPRRHAAGRTQVHRRDVSTPPTIRLRVETSHF